MSERTFEINYLPLEELVVSPHINVRKSVGDLTDLQRSIESMGLLQPIIIKRICQSLGMDEAKSWHTYGITLKA